VSPTLIPAISMRKAGSKEGYCGFERQQRLGLIYVDLGTPNPLNEFLRCFHVSTAMVSVEISLPGLGSALLVRPFRPEAFPEFGGFTFRVPPEGLQFG
jgi:hypothetical protein